METLKIQVSFLPKEPIKVNVNLKPIKPITVTKVVIGKKGKSAYEVAVLNGFDGNEQEWLDSLVGRDGYTPIKNIDYFDGNKGDKGDTGEQGIGVHGEQGIQGIQGLTGAKGQDGKSSFQSAIDGGFTGTEVEFNTQLASIGNISSVLDLINGEVI
jgi:hypothetical protein